MRSMKKILSFCLTLALLLGAAPLAFAADGSYTDVPADHWAYDIIEAWTGSGVLQGNGDGTFAPDREMTLGEFASMVSKLFGYTERTAAAVTPDWAGEYVEKAIAAGVLDAAASVDASVIVTREQAVKYMALAYGIAPVEGATTFTDDAAIDGALKPYVNAFQKAGYVEGMDGAFAPKSGLTRAEIVQIFENVGVPGVLKAGAGASEIVFDQAMFPVEGFSGQVHLNPYARVLVVEQKTKVAIVALEMVNVPADFVDACKNIVSEKTGVAPEHVWVHATHAITTPHAPGDAAQRELFIQALTAAVTEAAEGAAATFQEAVMGIGTGTCDVNANGNVELQDAYYVGLNSTLPSNKEMTIVRFDGLDGAPIGFLISYGIKPTAIDNSEMKANTRKLSSDVPGVACRMMEEKYDAPALFCMPAAGDQIPKEMAMYYVVNEAGEVEQLDLGVEAGIEIVDRLGAVMGDTCIEIADGITCTAEEKAISIADSSFTWASKGGDGEVEVAVRGITIGDDLAFVGFKPEVNAVTERELWEASPYAHTLLMSFIDGDQKYMPDASAYDLETWQWKRAGMAKGAAEEFVSTAMDLLKNIDSMNTAGGSADGSGGSAEKKTIQMGGVDWIVLEEQEDRMLVLSSQILEQRAYHAPGGAITWENCELRAYLNGEFLTGKFSEEEQAKILSVTLENKPNSQYGIAGGNDTTDKVFLLSLSEVEKYFGGSVDQLRAPLAGTGEFLWWHLRSPGEATDVNAGISAIGLIDYHGVVDGVQDAASGVRPAMWVTK